MKKILKYLNEYKNLKIIKTIIKILLVILIIGWIFGLLNNYSDENNTEKQPVKVEENGYLTIGKDPVIKNNFSIGYYWLVGGQRLDVKHITPVDKTVYKDLRTDKKFAFAVVTILNNNDFQKSINLNDFSFKSDNGEIYKPYVILDKTQEIKSIFDEKNKNILVSRYGEINITIEAGKEEKRAILFEVSKETTSGLLISKYNNANI